MVVIRGRRGCITTRATVDGPPVVGIKEEIKAVAAIEAQATAIRTIRIRDEAQKCERMRRIYLSNKTISPLLNGFW